MNDVAYRLNTILPVKKYGTITVNSGGMSIPIMSGGIYIDNTSTKTVVNEIPAGTGLVDRLDDTDYYQT